MTIGFLFWLFMILALVLGSWGTYRGAAPPTPALWWPAGLSVLVWLLFFLLGVQVFGWPIKG